MGRTAKTSSSRLDATNTQVTGSVATFAQPTTIAAKTVDVSVCDAAEGGYHTAPSTPCGNFRGRIQR